MNTEYSKTKAKSCCGQVGKISEITSWGWLLVKFLFEKKKMLFTPYCLFILEKKKYIF